jgi:prepilin-type N-terminal cleavage/methylation domain-containing protein
MGRSSNKPCGFLKTAVRGFTLLELITVVAITAIMVTIGVPSYG